MDRRHSVPSFAAANRPNAGFAAHEPIALRPVAESRTASSRRHIWMTAGPVLALLLGAGVVASAQSSSPFASQRKTQA
ncbi:MAG: hypothetical protein WBF53_10525, partial [Litorimonas sp.]